jgi:Xaa-Pro aminopeptidase
MLSDLDDLLKARGFEALVCLGDSSSSSPDLAYLTRAHIPRGGLYIKKLGGEPLLIVSPLDVGVARLGIVRDVRTFNDVGYQEILARSGRVRALPELVAKLLRAEGVSGPVSVCGFASSAQILHLVDTLRRKGFRLAGQARPTILDLARATKDSWEMEAITRCGAKTITVVRRVEKLLSEADVRGREVRHEGIALTVGAIKRNVAIWCAEQGLTLPEGLILSMGPESSDPHHPGSDEGVIRPGQPLVFDIFPKDSSGYMYDFTRTYVLGRPVARIRRMLEDVQQAHQIALDNIRDGVKCEVSFLRVCRFLRSRGWPTPVDVRRNTDGTVGRGFIHGLGHGVGLTIGEEPYLRKWERSLLRKDMVVTVEPGLYEPGLGGVRIEDVIAVEDGGARRLVEHPYIIEF